MERNWLIRTAQNQILGPVSKVKVVEFIQKGALGLTDEVSSGNGYWIGIKEKDLLEKYVFGDVPQSYNPISEAKTVLANKENPDLTSSLNLSPANIKMNAPVEVNEKVVLPKNDDLEFPDMNDIVSSIDSQEDVTRVSSLADFKKNLDEQVSIPNSSDLEFPDFNESHVDNDITRMTQAPKLSASDSDELKFEVPKEYQSKKSSTANSEKESQVQAVLPKQDDLEFPDLNAIIKKVDKSEATVAKSVSSENTSTKIDPGSPLNLEIDFTRTVALKDTQAKEILEIKKTANTPTKKLPNEQSKKVNLHERKQKPIFKKNIEELRDPKREQIYTKTDLPQVKKRNDTYLFFILFLVIVIIVAVFYYFKEILNKPFPV